MMFFYRKKSDEDYLKQLNMDVDELKQCKEEKLSVLYQALTKDNAKNQNYVAREIAEYMKTLNAQQIIRLEERFREFSSMEWRVTWENVSLSLWESVIKCKEDFLWVLRLGTFHPKGYFREKCINYLHQDGESVKYILLRLNDWALPVRKAAEKVVLSLIKVIGVEEILSCLAYLEKVKRGNRKDNETVNRVYTFFVDEIHKNIQNVEMNTILRYEPSERKFIYKLLLEHIMLTNEQVMTL